MNTDDSVKDPCHSFDSFDQNNNNELIDSSSHLQVDSIWLLKNTYPDLSSMITIDGIITRAFKPIKVGFGNKNLLKFLLCDETDSIWCCLWDISAFYPFHLDTFPTKCRVKISNATLQYNSHKDYKRFELHINSYDDISFL